MNIASESTTGHPLILHIERTFEMHNGVVGNVCDGAGPRPPPLAGHGNTQACALRTQLNSTTTFTAHHHPGSRPGERRVQWQLN